MSDPIIELFADVLDMPVEKLNDDTSPDNTSKWDSLAAMHLVAAIEETYDVRLSTQDIMDMSTIGRARSVLKNKGVDLP